MSAAPARADSNTPPLLLVVDDEEDVGMLFRHQFRREIRAGRVDLSFAHSAPEALAFLRGGGAQRVTRIFSDINMPGMSGLDLLGIVRQEFGPLPVHIVSAYGDERHMQEAAARGADGFLTKPIDFDALRRTAVASDPAP